MVTAISEKLSRFGKVLNIITKILAIVCIVIAICALIATFIVAILPYDLVISLLGSLNITSNILNIPADLDLQDFILPTAIGALRLFAIIACASTCLTAIFYAVIMFIISNFFKSTAIHNTPFLEENVKRLKITGIIMIVGALIIGWNSLIAAFAIFVFAYVFQYGTELQQQYDETL
jgi:hypothetical protein